MDNNTFHHTSFIPKKPVVTNGQRFQKPKKSFGFLSFFTTLVIVFIVFVTGGLYLYKDFLNKEIESKSQSLAITRESLEEGTLIELQNFNRRLNSSKNLLANHIVISPFFNLLNALTLPEVQYVNFTGVLSDSGFAVSMGGLAKDYRTIAVQSDLLNSDKAKGLNDVSFTNLKLSNEKDSKGYVSFDVSMIVDPSFISFENVLLQKKSTDTTQREPIQNNELTENLENSNFTLPVNQMNIGQ